MGLYGKYRKNPLLCISCSEIIKPSKVETFGRIFKRLVSLSKATAKSKFYKGSPLGLLHIIICERAIQIAHYLLRYEFKHV